MQRVKVSRKHQIAVPSEVRRKLGIEAGDILTVEISGDDVVLHKEPKNWAEHMRGLHKEIWKGIDPVAYVRSERDTWDE
jgi:AbrB family looped-hinge helix DNA binding protein